jgi:uncharacterized protein (DUF2132 family)
MSSVPPSPSVPGQARNPLHGVTLERLLTALVAHFGWDGLAQQVPLRCFAQEPSISSSLKVLRKTPWAREQVESLYLYMLRETARQQKELERAARVNGKLER